MKFRHNARLCGGIRKNKAQLVADAHSAALQHSETPREISRALKEIEDAENAAMKLDAIFGRDLVVKEQFMARTGREFRKAFRAAAR